MSSDGEQRVARTRALVLSYAQSLLATDGAAAITYSALSAATGVSRPTLYRHWPHITDLLHDLVPEGPLPGVATLSGDLTERLTRFLCGIRDSVTAGQGAATLLSLVPQAERDAASRDSLRWAMRAQSEALNQGLADLGVTIDDTALALLIGPVLFRRFVHRRPVTDAFVTDVVTRFVHSRATGSPVRSTGTGLAW